MRTCDLVKNFLLFFLSMFCMFPAKTQVLGGNVELQRQNNVVTAQARLLLRCCPLPTVNYLKVDWGDGTVLDSIPFIGSYPTNLPTVYYLKFVGTHTYSSVGAYTVSAGKNLFLAPGFVNIQNSSSKKLALRSVVNLQVISTVPPTSTASFMGDTLNCQVNNPNQYASNAGMQSPDGDSLAYSIDLHPELTGYLPPPLGINSSGLMTFTSNASGIYNVSYRTDAWRRSVPNGSYDMLTGSSFLELFITVCNMNAPTTGILNHQSDVGLKIFPNPATSKITIESKAIGSKINILNSVGQIVLTVLTTEAKQEIDIATLAPGIYFAITESYHWKFQKE